MEKLFPALAVVLMVCPALVAQGVTYTDDFNGANPDNPWLFADHTGTNAEYWDSSTGPVWGYPGPSSR